MATSAETAYALHGVAQDVREDGRSRLDYRHMSVELDLFPQASGSARLRLGPTDVLVGVVAELAEPDADTPQCGRILVSVDCACASSRMPDYGAADGALAWLAAALQPLYSAASIPAALEALGVVRGKQCWQLRVHAQLLRCDGCPLDALALAIWAALRSTRIPRLAAAASPAGGSGAGGGGAGGGGAGGAASQLDLDLDESLDESVPFDTSELPTYVTLASAGNFLVADCTLTERRVAGR